MPRCQIIAARLSSGLKISRGSKKENPDFHEDCIKFMRDIIDKGYAEKISAKQLSCSLATMTAVCGTFPTTGCTTPRKRK